MVEKGKTGNNINLMREFYTRSEAMEYEKYLKSLKNKEYILKNICNFATD